MFGFPASTEFNKRIPKQKFYDHIKISPSHKRFWVEQIRSIYWRNKLAATTLNLTEGQRVTEIEVLELCLHTPEFDEAILHQIDLKIPYHILFILTCKELVQAWIGYKEVPTSENRTPKIERYFHTSWMPEDNLKFNLNCLNMDAIYETLVRNIAGTSLSSQKDENLKESLAREKITYSLISQIKALENTSKKEKQLNRRVKINEKIKNLKNRLQQFQ